MFSQCDYESYKPYDYFVYKVTNSNLLELEDIANNYNVPIEDFIYYNFYRNKKNEEGKIWEETYSKFNKWEQIGDTIKLFVGFQYQTEFDLKVNIYAPHAINAHKDEMASMQRIGDSVFVEFKKYVLTTVLSEGDTLLLPRGKLYPIDVKEVYTKLEKLFVEIPKNMPYGGFPINSYCADTAFSCSDTCYGKYIPFEWNYCFYPESLEDNEYENHVRPYAASYAQYKIDFPSGITGLVVYHIDIGGDWTRNRFQAIYFFKNGKRLETMPINIWQKSYSGAEDIPFYLDWNNDGKMDILMPLISNKDGGLPRYLYLWQPHGFEIKELTPAERGFSPVKNLGIW